MCLFGGVIGQSKLRDVMRGGEAGREGDGVKDAKPERWEEDSLEDELDGKRTDVMRRGWMKKKKREKVKGRKEKFSGGGGEVEKG